jgi:hypothetical protein
MSYFAERDRQELRAALNRQRRARRATRDYAGYASNRGKRERGWCAQCEKEVSINRSSGFPGFHPGCDGRWLPALTVKPGSYEDFEAEHLNWQASAVPFPAFGRMGTDGES